MYRKRKERERNKTRGEEQHAYTQTLLRETEKKHRRRRQEGGRGSWSMHARWDDECWDDASPTPSHPFMAVAATCGGDCPHTTEGGKQSAWRRGEGKQSNDVYQQEAAGERKTLTVAASLSSSRKREKERERESHCTESGGQHSHTLVATGRTQPPLELRRCGVEHGRPRDAHDPGMGPWAQIPPAWVVPGIRLIGRGRCRWTATADPNPCHWRSPPRAWVLPPWVDLPLRLLCAVASGPDHCCCAGSGW